MWVLDGPTRVDAQLDLMFTNQEDLALDVMFDSSLGCSDHRRS